MRVGLAQLDIGWEDQERNYEKAAGLISKAAEDGCEVVCLPELFSTGVTLDSGRFAESRDGGTFKFLRRQAMENRITVVGSYIEENGGHLPLNTSITFDAKGTVLSKYHKTHLFTYGGEDKGYSLGKPSAVAYRLGEFTATTAICYDLRFPGLFQAGLDKGADLLIVQANWPNPRKSHWDTLLKARAIECQAYVAGVNQAGKSPNNTFFGASKIVNPHGEVIAEAGDKEGFIAADISAEDVRKNREKYPFMKERRRIT
ncbi:MAG: carbon-nitrogen family hydrolase [Candidatus Altiarchaeota archaeon]